MKKPFILILVLLFIVPFATAYGVTFYNPSWNPQDGKVFDVVEAGKAYVLDVKTDDIAITKVTFTINRTVKNGGITVYHLMSSPSKTPEVGENDSYEYNEIKYAGFVPFDTQKFIYEFKVSKGWLENNSVPRQAIVLNVYNTVLDSWDSLPTKITGDDADYVRYSAEGKGFHYLFIGKSQSGEEALAGKAAEKTEIKEDIEVKVEQPGEASKSQTVLAGDNQVKIPDTTQQTPVQPASAVPVEKAPAEDVGMDSKLFGAFMIISIVALVVIVYFVFGRKSNSYSVDKELGNYISESLKRGKSKDEVKNRLLEVGWHHERVNKALSKHKDADRPQHK